VSARHGRRSVWGLLLAAVVGIGAGCGGSGQRGSAFVTLSVDQFSLNGTAPVAEVTSSLGEPTVSTLACVTLRNNLKNPTVTAPTALDNVFVESYTVRLSRVDGGPAPGSFTFNTAVIVPAGTVAMGVLGGNTARAAVVIVPAQAKNEPPLKPAPPLPLNGVADITFKGQDGRGQRVEARGAVGVLWVGSQGTDSTFTVSCAGGTPTGPTGGT